MADDTSDGKDFLYLIAALAGIFVGVWMYFARPWGWILFWIGIALAVIGGAASGMGWVSVWVFLGWTMLIGWWDLIDMIMGKEKPTRKSRRLEREQQAIQEQQDAKQRELNRTLARGNGLAIENARIDGYHAPTQISFPVTEAFSQTYHGWNTNLDRGTRDDL